MLRKHMVYTVHYITCRFSLINKIHFFLMRYLINNNKEIIRQIVHLLSKATNNNNCYTKTMQPHLEG